jgi:hypothetical protein
VPVEVLVTMISGAAGVIGAVIAWLQAIRASRLRATADICLERTRSETALALEAIKAENERRRKAFDVAAQACAPIEAALGQVWHDIQTVKEIITKSLSPIRYDKDIALDALRPAVSGIEEGYSRCGSSIPETARSAWHKAKHCAGMVELTLREQDDFSSFSDRVVKILTEARRELTDHQIAMVAAREGLREMLIENVVRLL